MVDISVDPKLQYPDNATPFGSKATRQLMASIHSLNALTCYNARERLKFSTIFEIFGIFDDFSDFWGYCVFMIPIIQNQSNNCSLNMTYKVYNMLDENIKLHIATDIKLYLTHQYCKLYMS